MPVLPKSSLVQKSQYEKNIFPIVCVQCGGFGWNYRCTPMASFNKHYKVESQSCSECNGEGLVCQQEPVKASSVLSQRIPQSLDSVS